MSNVGLAKPMTWEEKKAEEERLTNLINFRKAEIKKLQDDIKFYGELKLNLWK